MTICTLQFYRSDLPHVTAYLFLGRERPEVKVQLHRKPKENFDVQRIWQAAHPHPEAGDSYAF